MRFSHALSASFAAAVLVWSGAAKASDALTVTAGTTLDLDGDQSYSELVVEAGATIHVKPKTDTASGAGFVRIKANRIVIEAGGSISATASGNRGYNGKAGGGIGGGQKGANANDPGSGGGYGGKGGDGVTPTCQSRTPGGGAFMTKPSLGSGGGAANVAGMGTKGGAGGGYIILEAAEIVIAGSVEARGEKGLVASKVGSGGGSGGYIEIVTNHLDLQAGGEIAANGGAGGVGELAIGGGGSGGIIVIEAPDSAGIVADVSGGDVSCGGPGPGAPGIVDTTAPAPACLDLDHDGHGAALCPDGSGDDCDDTETSVYPGAVEACDGLDQDCTGAPDDPAAPSACADGLVCVEADCVLESEATGSGVGSGTSGGATSGDSGDDEGCSTSGSPSRAPLPLVALFAAAGAAAIARKRRFF